MPPTLRDPTTASHHLPPRSPASLLFNIYPISTTSQQIFTSKWKWIGNLCWPLCCLSMLPNRQHFSALYHAAWWTTAVGEPGMCEPSARWRFITVKFLWTNLGLNSCSMQLQEFVKRTKILVLLHQVAWKHSIPTLIILVFLQIYIMWPNLIKSPFIFG